MKKALCYQVVEPVKFLKGREPARATEVAHILAREQELHNLQNKL